MKKKYIQVIGMFLAVFAFSVGSFSKNYTSLSKQSQTKSVSGNGIKELGTYPGH